MLQRFFKKIPKWVKDLPDDNPNKEVLVQLNKASKTSLESPREMNFSINEIKGMKNAERIKVALEQRGWVCEIQSDHSITGYFWVEAQNKAYSISKESLEHDEDTFRNIANDYEAIYDGWYASAD